MQAGFREKSACTIFGAEIATMQAVERKSA